MANEEALKMLENASQCLTCIFEHTGPDGTNLHYCGNCTYNNALIHKSKLNEKETTGGLQ